MLKNPRYAFVKKYAKIVRDFIYELQFRRRKYVVDNVVTRRAKGHGAWNIFFNKCNLEKNQQRPHLKISLRIWNIINTSNNKICPDMAAPYLTILLHICLINHRNILIFCAKHSKKKIIIIQLRPKRTHHSTSSTYILWQWVAYNALFLFLLFSFWTYSLRRFMFV